MPKPTKHIEKIHKEKNIIIQQKGKNHSHIFNESEIINFIKLEEYSEYLEQKNQTQMADNLSKQLELIIPKNDWILSIKKSSFNGIRAIYGNYDPLDIAGTLADGGRLNIGGAQQQSKKYKKMAGLYFADSVETALQELSLPIATNIVLPIFYQVEFKDKKETLKLFNLDNVLLDLDKIITLPSNISTLCSSSPFAGNWGDQKIPAPSQIVGQWLRNLSLCEGITFRSTKNSSGFNYFLFLKDTNSAKINLKSKVILKNN